MTGASDTQPAAPFDKEAVREEIRQAVIASATLAGIADAILPIFDRLLAESEERVRSCEAFLTMKKADHEAALTEIAKIMNGTAHEADLQEMESLRLILREWLSKAGGEFAKLKASLATAQAEIARKDAALEWYGENARLCRLSHSEGDPGRHALSEDGGKRAREALSTAPGEAEQAEPNCDFVECDGYMGAEERCTHPPRKPTNPRPVVPEELVRLLREYEASDFEHGHSRWVFYSSACGRYVRALIHDAASGPEADLGFTVGERVEKYKGEARWIGTIVSAYTTGKGSPRYVVDVEPQGFQMIAVPSQLRTLIQGGDNGR